MADRDDQDTWALLGRTAAQTHVLDAAERVTKEELVEARRWGFAEDYESESWMQAEATGRDEVIAEARAYFKGGGFTTIAICRCEPVDIEVVLPDADHLIEGMNECAYDHYGDWIGDWPKSTKDLRASLAKALRDWAAKHIDVGERWFADDVETVEVQAT